VQKADDGQSVNDVIRWLKTSVPHMESPLFFKFRRVGITYMVFLL